MTTINMDHVERLSRGKKSGAKIGSRAVGHYLKPHERDTFNRALAKGYLVIHEKDRANLWHIWEKACLAKGIPFLILIKDTQNALGTVYQNDNIAYLGSLEEAKKIIQTL